MNEEFNSSNIIAEMAKVRSGSARCTRRRAAGFADGGKVDAAEEMMARMNAKYGTTGAF